MRDFFVNYVNESTFFQKFKGFYYTRSICFLRLHVLESNLQIILWGLSEKKKKLEQTLKTYATL